MVEVRVHVVDSNGVDAENLHKGCVAKAFVFVGQRIHSARRRVASAATRLVSNTNDLVTITSCIVDKVAALDIDGGDGSGQRGGAEETQDGSSELYENR